MTVVTLSPLDSLAVFGVKSGERAAEARRSGAIPNTIGWTHGVSEPCPTKTATASMKEFKQYCNSSKTVVKLPSM